MKSKTLKKKFSKEIVKFIKDHEDCCPKKGRPLKENIEYYVKYILFKLFTGISWDSLDYIVPKKCAKGDAIRKRFICWKNKGYFQEIYNIMFEKYSEKHIERLKILFIDSTVIPNFSGTKKMTGFNKKIPGKRSFKVTSQRYCRYKFIFNR